MLPLLVLPFIAVLPLELVLEMAEHALWLAWRWGVDEIFHWIGQHMVLHSRTRKPTTTHACIETQQEGVFVFLLSSESSKRSSRYIFTQTFRQQEDFGVHVSAELLVFHQILVVMGPQQSVVSHHLIVNGNGGVFSSICTSLWMCHPQCVRVLLVTHSGHILPDFTQGTSVVLHPQELRREMNNLTCQNKR